MNRKQVIEHFAGLAELTGKPFKTVPARHGTRLIHAGHSVILPPRREKIRHVGLMASKLGLYIQDLPRL